MNTASVKGGFVLLLVLLVDQISKALVLSHVSSRGVIPVISHLNIVCVLNRGISFGLLSSGGTWQLVLIWCVVICLVVYLGYQFWYSSSWVLLVCVGAILGGAIGNIVDRAIHGAVVDFIDVFVTNLNFFGVTVKEWHWPAFNVADSAVVVGVLGLIFLQLRNETRGSPARKRKS
ncbi:MAG: signal peptidase II [Holosporales bacterium]|nr:signal peptidase II [Holosporales bacterium]